MDGVICYTAKSARVNPSLVEPLLQSEHEIIREIAPFGIFNVSSTRGNTRFGFNLEESPLSPLYIFRYDTNGLHSVGKVPYYTLDQTVDIVVERDIKTLTCTDFQFADEQIGGNDDDEDEDERIVDLIDIAEFAREAKKFQKKSKDFALTSDNWKIIEDGDEELVLSALMMIEHTPDIKKNGSAKLKKMILTVFPNAKV